MKLRSATVVIPTYRGADRLPKLFDALAEQQGSDFEVIVVVDGVDDGTPALVEAEDRFDVRAIVFPENRGRVAALNAGFEEACGEILIRSDDDLLPRPDWVACHVATHEKRHVGVVGMCINVPHDTTYARVYDQVATRQSRDAAAADPRAWARWGANVSVDRTMWNEIGDYDPAYRLYGWEDVDYGYRIHLAGYPVVIQPGVEVLHRAASETAEGRMIRSLHSGAARHIFEDKFPHNPLPDPTPELSAWNALVRATSHLTGRWPHGIGRAIDRSIDHLPASLARKLIALGVESAAIAGYRSPTSAHETF